MPHFDHRHLLYDSPALLLGPSPSKAWVDVSVGGNTVCGIASTNQTNYTTDISCWGANNHLQAKPNENCVNYSKILAGWDHFCGIFTRDEEPEPRKNYVTCWGDCSSGRCAVPGNPPNLDTSPSASAGGFNWLSVSCGSYHCCGIAEVDVDDPNIGWRKENQVRYVR